MLSCLICLYCLLDLFGLFVLFQCLFWLSDLFWLFEWSVSFWCLHRYLEDLGHSWLFVLLLGLGWTVCSFSIVDLFGMLDSLGCVYYFLDLVVLFWLFGLVMRCVGSLVCLYCVLDLFGPFGLCALSWLVFVRLSLLAFLVFCLSWLFGMFQLFRFLVCWWCFSRCCTNTIWMYLWDPFS